jgi:hypothetical protein
MEKTKIVSSISFFKISKNCINTSNNFRLSDDDDLTISSISDKVWPPFKYFIKRLGVICDEHGEDEDRFINTHLAVVKTIAAYTKIDDKVRLCKKLLTALMLLMDKDNYHPKDYSRNNNLY